tara:strand:+ start:137094 stop:140477 length:3384 start_codon:yes stop_codon:yes gene_type:complete
MKLIHLSAVFFFFTILGFGQCPVGDSTFVSQAQLDDFIINYPNCTQLVKLTILGNAVNDLTPLGNIESVRELVIQGTNLPNLNGLENLSTIGFGQFGQTYDLQISSNTNLSSLQALSNLVNNGDLDIMVNNNQLLPNFLGLENLSGIVDEFNISQNPGLQNFAGLDGLTYIKSFGVHDNLNLISFQGLTNLGLVREIAITNNSSLQILDFPKQLSLTFDGIINIDGNILLSSIDAFVPFANNSGISISINITNNPILSQCSVNFICDAFINSTSVTISNNAVGCNSQAEVQANCGICPGAGGVTLSSQAEVDAFPLNYPGCTQTKYSVRISGNDIVDLSPLSQLETVAGIYVNDNLLLENLDGLENILSWNPGPNSGGNYFYIQDNASLTNIDALSNAVNVDPLDFIIQNNPMLSSLSGFQNLEGIVSLLLIENNNSLVNLDGLEGITYIDEILIRDNANLNSVSGLSSLNRTGNIQIINNDNLPALDFPNLIEHLGSLNIVDNLILNDIDTFSPSATFPDELTIENNPTLAFCSTIIICNILDNGFTTISISNNASGCNTQTEVEANCGDYTDVTNFISGAWDNGVPDNNKFAVIIDDYNTGTYGSIDANRLIVESGAVLTVAANTYLNIETSIAVNGNLVVEHQGSVVQENDLAQTFNNNQIEVLLSTPDLDPNDFMVLGSPMTASDRTGVWNSAFLVLDHHTVDFVPHPDVAAQFPDAENFADDNNNFWTSYTGAINPGEGYIVRPQTGYGQPGGVFDYTYNSGTLTNGTITRPVIYNTPGPTAQANKNASPNTVANPYPSAIWAIDFIKENPTVDELYFWEHNTPPSTNLPGAGSMNFSMQDISMYNLSGGVAAASGGTAPNGYISTGQGFAFKANAAGTATFTNTMRRLDNNNTLRATNQSDRLWLKIEAKDYKLGSTALLSFNEEATSGFDAGYDSKRLATVVSLFSMIEGDEIGYGIQTREAMYHGMQIGLGFSTLLEDTVLYTISIDDFEGIASENTTVYLIDLELNKKVNLSKEAYQFSSSSGTFNRFVVVFENELLATNSISVEEGISVFPNPVSETLTILISENFNYIKSEIYSVTGQKLQETANKQIGMGHLSAGIYFVKVISEEGTITKKIVKQ